MIAAINDLPFHYQMSSLHDAVSRFSAFIKICKSIEDGHMTNVEKIVIAPESDYSGHLAPGLVLQQIIPKIKSKEDQRYIMSLLKNRDAAPIDADTAPFCFDGKESQICSYAKDDVVVSLCSSPVFETASLSGMCCDKACDIRNLSAEEHSSCHMEHLGIRLYHANSGKHTPFRELTYAGGKTASSMDLDDAAAQTLLNKAVLIDNRLYAKMGGKIYTFMREAPCIYHGYINNQVPDNVQRLLEKYPWDETIL